MLTRNGSSTITENYTQATSMTSLLQTKLATGTQFTELGTKSPSTMVKSPQVILLGPQEQTPSGEAHESTQEATSLNNNLIFMKLSDNNKNMNRLLNLNMLSQRLKLHRSNQLHQLLSTFQHLLVHLQMLVSSLAKLEQSFRKEEQEDLLEYEEFSK